MTNESNVRRKLLLLALLAVVVGGALVYWREQWSLSQLVAREAQLRAVLHDNPWAIYAGALLLYVAVTAFSLPGATAMTLLYGWFFGFWPALMVVSVASTLGATLAFLSARYFLRDAVVSRFGVRAMAVQQAFDRDGVFYLYLLRLTPVVPFVLVNLVMGLTSIRTLTFALVSQAGMFPATCIFVAAGAHLPSAQAILDHGAAGVLKPQLIAALAALGLFPLAAKWLAQYLRRKRAA